MRRERVRNISWSILIIFVAVVMWVVTWMLNIMDLEYWFLNVIIGTILYMFVASFGSLILILLFSRFLKFKD